MNYIFDIGWQEDEGTQPESGLHFELYNEQMDVVGTNTGILPVDDRINKIQDLNSDKIVIQESGYLEIFVNNEAQTPVYYDNLMVTQSMGAVLEVNAYYPYGKIIQELSTSSTYGKNNYKYNGKEMQTDMDLNWLDFGARMMDPVIGRWWVSDPLSEMYYCISPDACAANNPIKYIDIDGRKIKVANNHAITAENLARIAVTNLGGGYIDRLIISSFTYTTKGTFFTRSSGYDPIDRSIYFVANPWRSTVPDDGGALTSWTAMGHEMQHAYDHDMGYFDYETAQKTRISTELVATSFENYLREVYSLMPL